MTTQNNIGVGFSNSTADVVTSGGLSASAVSNAEAVKEQEISFSQIAKREQLISTFSWTAANDAGTDLINYELPYGVLVSNTLKVSFERFIYWFGDCHLRVTLQSNAFQQGQLIASFMPLSDNTEDVNTSTLTDKSIRRNMILKAGSTSSKTLVIPFASFYAAYQVGNTVPLGNFTLSVMNRLRHGPDAGAGADRAEISIFASFPDANFKVIQPATDNLSQLSTLNNGLLPAAIRMQGGVASKVTNIHIDKVTGSTVDVKSDKDTMDTKQKGTVGGLDRPNIGLNYTPLRMMKFPDLATGKNLDYCGVLDLDPGNSYMLQPNDIAQSHDENDLKYLLTKWCYVKTGEVTDAMATGTIVDSDWMTIAPRMFTAYDTEQFQPSLMEYVSIPYSLWRGSLKLRFEFVMTKIHVVRMSFITHYGGEVTDTNLVNSYGQYAQIFDVSAENNTFEVEVPYRSAYDWLKIPHGSGDPREYTMGQWSLRILNPLVVMPSIADRIEYNVYICAGDDVELKFLGSGAADCTPYVDNEPPAAIESLKRRNALVPESKMWRDVMRAAEELKVQSGEAELVGDAGIDTVDESKDVPVAVAPSSAPLGPCNLDDWRNLRTCFKRSAPVYIGTELPANFTSSVSTLMDNHPIISWYSKMFRAWSGPIKVRVLTGGEFANIGYVPSDTLEPILNGLGSTETPTTGFVPLQLTNEEVGVLDAQIPFITNKKFLLTTRGTTASFPPQFYSPGNYFITSGAKDPATPSLKYLYTAGGDTFRTALLISVPKIRVNTKYFVHGGSDIVQLPSAITFTIVPTVDPALNNVTQLDIDNSIQAGADPILKTFTLSTVGWTREQWNRIYGHDTLSPYQVPDPTLPPETSFVYFPLGELFAPYRAGVTQGEPGTPTAYGFANVTASGNTVAYDILPSGKKVFASDTFVVPYAENTDVVPLYAQLLGLEFAPGQYFIPQIVTGPAVVAIKATPTAQGPTIYLWDTKGGYAFNDPEEP